MENAYANRANHDFLRWVLGRRNSALNPAVSVLFSPEPCSIGPIFRRRELRGGGGAAAQRDLRRRHTDQGRGLLRRASRKVGHHQNLFIPLS